MSKLLTVAMIARNEAGRIASSIESARALADEIIVVDTGSTDPTAQIARDLGARVIFHEWNDDFAAARNAAIPHLQSRWTLWLDADERIVPDSIDEFRPYLLRDDVLAYGIIRRDHVGGLKPGEKADQYVSTIILRVLRNDLGFSFTGRCHEQPHPWPNNLVARTGLKLVVAPLTLDHDCDYYFEGRFRKAQRNGRLLEMEVRDRPGRLYWMIHCGATLLDIPESAPRGHQVMRQALEQIARMRDCPRPPFALVEIALEYAAYAPPHDQLPLSADEAASLAERWFPNAAPIIWMRAKRAFEQNDFEAAIPILRRLISMGQTGAYDREVPFDHIIVGDDARLNLGVCLLRLGQLEEAESLFTQISPTGPRAQEAAMNLNVVQSIRRQFNA
jgi:tetratricopeptide (TPR) repeat protein